MNKRKVDKTFYDWCIENKRQDLLDRWDYKLNEFSPKDIGFRTHNKYYFKCPNGIHESEAKIIGNYTGKNRSHIILCNKCNSFAQYLIDLYGENALELYWDYEKNNMNPWEISKNSSRKSVYIKCQEKSYHKSYQIYPSSFIYGNRCPYCSHHKIHPLDSLGTLYPNSIKYWSDKNEKTPFQYSPHSGMQVYWKCIDNSHENYQRSINTAVRFEFRCPECSREQDVSILESKVTTYLSDVLGYKVLHEQNCTLVPTNPKKLGTNYTMPFDNEIIVSGKHLLTKTCKNSPTSEVVR